MPNDRSMTSRSISTWLLALLALTAAPAIGRAAADSKGSLTPEEQRLINAVDARNVDFAADLGQAVQIDSATENLAGVRQLGELFAGQLAELGFESHFVPLPASTGRAGHLVAEHRGSKGKRVLLIGHLDLYLATCPPRADRCACHRSCRGRFQRFS